MTDKVEYKLRGKDMNQTEYNTIHRWLLRNFKNPKGCEQCGVEGKMIGRRWSIEHALKPNELYAKNINNFTGLCGSCHKKMDKWVPTTCTVMDCEKPYLAKDFCSKHYMENKKVEQNKLGKCTHCERSLYSKTLCLHHVEYNRQYKIKVKESRSLFI